jgi:hypothetical protein
MKIDKEHPCTVDEQGMQTPKPAVGLFPKVVIFAKKILPKIGKTFL